MTGEQRARVRMSWRRENAARRSGLDALPGIDDADIVAQLGDDAEIVRDEQHRQAELAHQIAQQFENLPLRRDVERGGRLVGDDQRRRAGERGGDQQPLPLPARELVRIAVERRLRVGQLHAAEQRQQCARCGALRSCLRLGRASA